MKYWIELLFGLIVTGFTTAYRHLAKRVKADRKEQVAIRDGMQALLRDRIIQAYNHYHEDIGACPIYAQQSITSLYEAYHALGGNGTITALMTKLEKLPTDKKEA